jgi:N-acylneuraminate cytidylyltransferase
MYNLAIIPARGGSKRIPGKNIKSFLGKPIISYSIEAAIKSNLFDEVMVSTDNNEIAEMSIKFGAKVPFFRSKLNSNDYATTYDVIDEVCNQYFKMGRKIDNVCCIYACAPFINESKLNESFELMTSNQYDSIIPIMPFGFPIQRALKIEENSRVSYMDSIYSLTRSQDLEKFYHDAGQFYWINNLILEHKKTILTDNTGYYLLNELEGQDIDSEVDWKLAELKYELLQNIK